jgi:predicted trehalose synthase|tara:strand:- start:24 stop:230 length:207 start_codon:yes stop_codon:yes gene_type:complete
VDALTFSLAILRWAPAAIKGVYSAREAIAWGTKAVERMVAEARDPTDEEQAELDAKITALREALHSDE